MQLHARDGNPIPDGAVVGTVVTPDGVSLRFARWRQTGARSLGTICLLQGRAECIEIYFETIADLRRRGFTVATFDWRGQGGSDRHLRNPAKGHVDSFAEYDRDLDAFVQQVMLPDCPPPHYGLAHSMGGLVALRHAHENRLRFARMVLTSPLLGLGQTRPPPAVAYRLSAVMTAVGLGELSAPRGSIQSLAAAAFDVNPLTRDPRRFARAQSVLQSFPQLAVGAPTYAWIYAASRAMAEAGEPDFTPQIKTPTLIVAGALDTVVSLTAIERLAAEMRMGGQVVIRGAHHHLLLERDVIREQVFAAFDSFVPGS